MDILLYDNWERALLPSTAVRKDSVGWYCCGPTVYDCAHIGKRRTLAEIDRVLGMRLAKWQPKKEAIPKEIQALLERRVQSRAAKNGSESDTLRKEIENNGFVAEDFPRSARVERQ